MGNYFKQELERHLCGCDIYAEIWRTDRSSLNGGKKSMLWRRLQEIKSPGWNVNSLVTRTVELGRQYEEESSSIRRGKQGHRFEHRSPERQMEHWREAIWIDLCPLLTWKIYGEKWEMSEACPQWRWKVETEGGPWKRPGLICQCEFSGQGGYRYLGN